MPFVQRVVNPIYLSRTSLWDEDGRPKVADNELDAVTNNTLCNALRQLASLALLADDVFTELGQLLKAINERSDALCLRIPAVAAKVSECDPKKVPVPESDICTFATLKHHFAAKSDPETNLFTVATRPRALQDLYDGATKTPIHLMRQMDRWRRDGHRSSRFFLCTPVLGNKRRRIRNRVDIDIETCMPAAVQELRRWTSSEALGDVTVTPDCPNRIAPNVTLMDADTTDRTAISDDEAIDHKLPSPEEQLQVVALKFPAEIVAVDVSGRSFDRMSMQRRSLLQGDISAKTEDVDTVKRRTRTRKPRSRRRNTLAGTDQKEIRDALGEEPSSSSFTPDTETTTIGAAVSRSKSSDLLRSSKKDTSSDKKSHFNTLKQWGKNRYERFINKNSEPKKEDIDDFNIYETVTMKRRRNVDKKTHERNPSISSSEKSSVNLPISSPLTSVMNIAVKLRESSAQRRQRRSGGNKDEPHSSSGNWSASSESGRASIGSEFTNTTHPKSTSTATSSNSLNQPPNSVNSRRRFNINTSTSSSITSEGTLTPDIIHDIHEDGETSSVYSCDTEGYYTSFHMDSGLKTLKEEELPCTPLHSTSAFSNHSPNTVLSAENEYELFGKGSTSTTTSSAGTVCTTLRASDSSRSLSGCPPPPERKSSLAKSPESSLERDGDSNKTGTVKRSPATKVVAMVHNTSGDVSPDSGHNTSSSPIESNSSPNGLRSGSDFEFSESSDIEGSERTERIRVKTTINSSRIPSMCVITPPHSDDESVTSSNSLNNFNRRSIKIANRNNLELNLKQSEYEANVLKSSDSDKENFNIQRMITTSVNGSSKLQLINVNPMSGYATIETVEPVVDINKNSKVLRAPSPSGGSVTINAPGGKPVAAPPQPIIKATLLPLNNMLGKLKTNLVNFAHKRESKSPIREDVGDYVTLADLKNNNEKVAERRQEKNVYANNLVQMGEAKQAMEYVSLSDLPCNEQNPGVDSLERKKRQGARVTLDAEGKVVYSSDSLRRRKTAHTTFEPGPCVKPVLTPTQSPVPIHRLPKSVRPVPKDQNRAMSPQLVIKAVVPGTTEIVRLPSSIIAPSTRSAPPRGAYVHMQDSPTTQDQDRVPYRTIPEPEMYDPKRDNFRDNPDQYYTQKGPFNYQTMPSKRSQFFHVDSPERSVTPDITRGLERNYRDAKAAYKPPDYKAQVPSQKPQSSPSQSASDDAIKISPIDPRNYGGFHASTPSAKTSINLESVLLSPKKSTMSNDELYAVIHKSKKKMNITSEERRAPVCEPVKLPNSPETGYIGDKSRSRLSWSPSKGDYVDFNPDIDKLSPPNDSRSRQSWACGDRKGTQQTSRLDFKKLLLQKSNVLSGAPKKMSAVEQLKLSKVQKPPEPALNILDLSGSPRSLVARKNLNAGASSPRSTPEKPKAAQKILSPRAQWRFASPRSDVLSSTILEDCREDESPGSSMEKKKKAPGGEEAYTSISQRLQARRAQFFHVEQGKEKPPTLETAF